MKTIPTPRPRIYRFFEIMPGLAAWSALVLLVFAGIYLPVWAAVIIIVVDLYWLFKITYQSAYLIAGYRKMKSNLGVDWLKKAKSIKNAKAIKDLNFDNLYHLIIYTIYNEHEVIESTLESLAKSNYPKDKIMVVVTAEEKGYEQTKEVLERMEQKYKGFFKKFMITVHPSGIPGELVGKGSNETWGGQRAREFIDQMKIPYENILISVFDIDTQIHENYLARVAEAYLSHPNPLRVSYQPIPIFMNNAWDAPAIARVVSCSTTFWQMMEQGRPERMATFSSHSMSFKTIVDVDFWSTDAVSEDSRIYWQCLLHYNGDYEVSPLFFPVSMDMVLDHSYMKTLVNQYKQQRRWAWGVENLPYLFYGLMKNKLIHPWIKFRSAYKLWDGAFSWATTAIIIAILGWLPLLFGGDAFNNTVFAQTLPVITRTLSTLAMIGLFTSTIISNVLLPKRPAHEPFWKSIAMVFQWFLLPITTILFGSVVALDAQTRLMLGKYMGFFVTPKARKQH